MSRCQSPATASAVRPAAGGGAGKAKPGGGGGTTGDGCTPWGGGGVGWGGGVGGWRSERWQAAGGSSGSGEGGPRRGPPAERVHQVDHLAVHAGSQVGELVEPGLERAGIEPLPAGEQIGQP